jgi:hypothetical protein
MDIRKISNANHSWGSMVISSNAPVASGARNVWHKRQSAEVNIVKMLRMPYIDHNGVLQTPEKD